MQRVIGYVLFVIAAGNLTNVRGNVFFVVYFLFAIIASVILYNGYQDVLSARENKKENTKGWDTILVLVLVLMSFFGIYIVAGLGVRFNWSQLSNGWLIVGYLLTLISTVLSTWSLIENRHFEGYVRIQKDREHQVISTGPYRLVRHPGYLGSILGMIAVALIFGTLAIGITAVMINTIFIIRTYYEDNTLKEELDGYLAYCAKVKYRLIPFVW